MSEDTLRNKMIDKAQDMYGVVRPCLNQIWNTSFTTVDGELWLWFLSEDNSTHVVSESMVTEGVEND